jgi:DNA-binding MarR family transcriptional regulator
MEQESTRSDKTTKEQGEAEARVAVPPEILLGYRLWQASHLWQRQVGRELKPLGLTPVRYVLLAAAYHLINCGQAPSQIRLSDFTGVEKMMVSKNLRVLAAEGYISRTASATDRRVVEVRLTAAGREILQRAFAAALAAHDSVFRVLGEEWSRMNGLLRSLIRGHMA